MFYDALKNDHGFAIDPFKALVAPRPIGWVSSVSPRGAVNLAPFSYFNAMSEAPHYLALGFGADKDTLGNIRATLEFAVNIVTWDLREPMNQTSARVAAGVDEYELAGLAKAACRTIAPPRVAESPVCFECRLFQIVPLPGDDGSAGSHMVIGRVLGIHIDDRFITDGRVDTAAMRPISRLGYSEYATVAEAWRMRRPG